MLSSMNPPCVTWRKRNALLLLLAMLIEGVASTSDPAGVLSLRKCRCNKDQAWDGAKCLDSLTTIPIYNTDLDLQKDESNGGSSTTTPIYNTDLDVPKGETNEDNNTTVSIHNKAPDAQGEVSSVIYIPTNMAENVTVLELNCPKDLFLNTLKENTLLLRDGRLLWLTTMSVFTNEEFCIEHFWEAGEVFFDVEVCLPPPAVPRCCPKDHLLDRDGSCHPQEALQAPPLQLGSHEVDWDLVGGDMVTLACGEHEYLRHIDLGPGKGQLDNTQPTAALAWRPKEWVPFESWMFRYCVALQETDTGELQYGAQICFKDHARYHKHQCGNSLCVRKCCSEQSLFSLGFGRCVEALNEREIWSPSQIPGQKDINDEWKIVSGEPGCHAHSYLGEMHLLSNGYLQIHPEKPPVLPSRYCLDNLLVDENNITNFAVLCYVTEDTSCMWRDTLIKVLVGVSCVFLMVILAVYLGVADLRDRTYGRCLISMVAAMLTAYLCLVSGINGAGPGAACYALAFVNHFSALAMFFWLNVMCFDMWKTIRGSTKQHHSMKVFLWYSLYAWGCPVVVSSVTLILDITAPKNIILPQYSDGKCWFNENKALWAYFSGFILVLVVANVGFFIHVAMTLYQKQRQMTQILETGTSQTNKTTSTRQQVLLFAKLFVVMGVLWITDSLSALSHRKTCSYWVFTDILNALQGIFIFIVAVCNKDKLKKVKDAWRPRLNVIRTSFTNTSRRPTQNITSTDDTEASRKTSTTSLPRKISQVSNIFFPSSSKKTANLNPADSSADSHSGRKHSNVSIKDVIQLSAMEE